MFNTFFDSENQNIDFNIQSQKPQKFNSKNDYNINGNNSFYFGKDNKAIEQINKKKNVINNARYIDQKNAKNISKIKIIVYQNGFIVNNGEFKNKSISENRRFLEEIERGDIPTELIKKGIMDAEILLENRKNEVYYSTYYQDTDNINYIGTDIFQDAVQMQTQDPDLYSLLYNNNNYNQNNDLNLPPYSMANTYNVYNKNKNNNQNQKSLYSSNTLRVDNKKKIQKNIKRKNSQNVKNFVDFLEFKKENDKKEKQKKEENDEKKEFKAFSGFGQIIGNINTQGLYVNKDVSTLANLYMPICYINIRLFNGEIIKAPFNYEQTIGDIYIYVRKVSGSNNFVLLEGFPPKEIISYGSQIYQLGLQNNVLTQKIK